MSDPVLDEDFILHMLKVPVIADNIETIQGGAVQALIDMYDRKVTREEFIAGAAPCLGLYGQAAKLWMLHNVRDVFEAGNLELSKFTDADQRMTQILRKQCEVVIELVKRLQECPTSASKVH